MKPVEFEEKEYEGPLYNQLERGSQLIWPPGQVLEEYLGFDRIAYLDYGYLWHIHGIHQPYRGVVPFRFVWPSLPHAMKFRLPRFRANCFIQAKRPEVGKRIPKKLAALGIRKPYFRFAIESDQQRVLEAAARRLRKRALFVYAAPVFSKSQELFAHTVKGTIVERSTFPDVLSLAGHRAWFYNEPGASGVVNQGFEALRLPEMHQQISSLVEQQGDRNEATQSPSDALVELRKELEAVVTESAETADQVRSAYLTEEWRRIASFSETTKAPQAVIAFLGVQAFALYFNLTWLTVA